MPVVRMSRSVKRRAKNGPSSVLPVLTTATESVQQMELDRGAAARAEVIDLGSPRLVPAPVDLEDTIFLESRRGDPPVEIGVEDDGTLSIKTASGEKYSADGLIDMASTSAIVLVHQKDIGNLGVALGLAFLRRARRHLESLSLNEEDEQLGDESRERESSLGRFWRGLKQAWRKNPSAARRRRNPFDGSLTTLSQVLEGFDEWFEQMQYPRPQPGQYGDEQSDFEQAYAKLYEVTKKATVALAPHLFVGMDMEGEKPAVEVATLPAAKVAVFDGSDDDDTVTGEVIDERGGKDYLAKLRKKLSHACEMSKALEKALAERRANPRGLLSRRRNGSQELQDLYEVIVDSYLDGETAAGDWSSRHWDEENIRNAERTVFNHGHSLEEIAQVWEIAKLHLGLKAKIAKNKAATKLAKAAKAWMENVADRMAATAVRSNPRSRRRNPFPFLKDTVVVRNGIEYTISQGDAPGEWRVYFWAPSPVAVVGAPFGRRSGKSGWLNRAGQSVDAYSAGVFLSKGQIKIAINRHASRLSKPNPSKKKPSSSQQEHPQLSDYDSYVEGYRAWLVAGTPDDTEHYARLRGEWEQYVDRRQSEIEQQLAGTAKPRKRSARKGR